MGHAFWVKRFVIVAFVAITVLTTVELLKGHGFVQAIYFGLGWGVLASALFTGTRIYRSRKGQHCAICNDIPEQK